MQLVLTGLHVIVSVFLVLVVLLQRGKRADLAGAFGGGGTQTAFGARQAADLLTKLTTLAAVLFMVTSLGLTILSTQAGGGGGGSSVIEDVAPATQNAPAGDAGALPATPPPAEPAPAGGADDPATGGDLTDDDATDDETP